MTGVLSGHEGTAAKDLEELIDGEVVIAVGVPQGVNVQEDDPDSFNQRLVRIGDDFVPLFDDAWHVWVSALAPMSRAELSTLASAEAGQRSTDELLAYLFEAGLLAAFTPGSSWLSWSKRLRVLPMAVGLGNSRENLATYVIQGWNSDKTLSVNAFSYWNWLSWNGTAPIFDGAQGVATQLEVPLDTILEHARILLLACLIAGFVFVDSEPVGIEAPSEQHVP